MKTNTWSEFGFACSLDATGGVHCVIFASLLFSVRLKSYIEQLWRHSDVMYTLYWDRQSCPWPLVAYNSASFCLHEVFNFQSHGRSKEVYHYQLFEFCYHVLKRGFFHHCIFYTTPCLLFCQSDIFAKSAFYVSRLRWRISHSIFLHPPPLLLSLS